MDALRRSVGRGLSVVGSWRCSDRGGPLRVAGILLFLALAAAVAGAGAREMPDFSGHWVLVRRAAETIPEPGAHDDVATRPSRRTGGPGEARWPAASDALPRAERERLATLERAAERLVIRREGTGFVIEDALGRAWPVTADGSEQAVEGSDGSVTYVRSEWGEWEGLRLWRVHAGEPTVQESYALSDPGNELLVQTAFPGERRGTTPIRRRYRRAPAETPAPAP